MGDKNNIKRNINRLAQIKLNLFHMRRTLATTINNLPVRVIIVIKCMNKIIVLKVNKKKIKIHQVRFHLRITNQISSTSSKTSGCGLQTKKNRSLESQYSITLLYYSLYYAYHSLLIQFPTPDFIWRLLYRIINYIATRLITSFIAIDGTAVNIFKTAFIICRTT